MARLGLIRFINLHFMRAPTWARATTGGEALSPLLFDLAIYPLQKILEIATNSGLLKLCRETSSSPGYPCTPTTPSSFLTPDVHDIANLVALLQNFGDVTDLVTNMVNSSVAPIRCADIDITGIIQNFRAALMQILLKYLGLLLSLGRLWCVDLQPYVNKASSKLNPWKAKFLSRDGRAELVKSVLTSMSIFLLTAIKVDKSTLNTPYKICRGLLWAP